MKTSSVILSNGDVRWVYILPSEKRVRRRVGTRFIASLMNFADRIGEEPRRTGTRPPPFCASAPCPYRIGGLQAAFSYLIRLSRTIMHPYGWRASVEFLSRDRRIEIRLPGEGGGIDGLQAGGDDYSFADEGLQAVVEDLVLVAEGEAILL